MRADDATPKAVVLAAYEAAARPPLAARLYAASLRSGGGRVDATGAWLVGAKGEYPINRPYLLRDGVSYRELGGDYFDHLQAQRLTRYHTQRLAALCYTVTLTKSAA